MIRGRLQWNKYESLEYLKNKNYNTPDFRLVTNTEELNDVVKEFRDEAKISIRSFRPNQLSFNEPFYPNRVMTVAVVETLIRHLRDGYHLIMARGVDPTGTAWKGNIMIYPSFSMRRFDFLVEATSGYGTVRDLETSKEVKRFTNIREAIDVIGYQIQKVVIAAKDIFADMLNEPIIVEWSIYDFPVGLRNKDIIYWEVRKGTSHVA